MLFRSLIEARGRYYDLYTRQYSLESNLFLAPGEGDAASVHAEDGSSGKNNDGDVSPADALRLIRGEVR